MKIATAGWLAAAAMTLTSLTVAALTHDESEPAPAEPAHKLALAQPDLQLDVDLSHFSLRGTLELEGRLGHGVVHASQATETYLALTVNSAEGATASRPAPLNLAIVLDRSGSMQGQRLRNAVEAARGMVRRLRDGDVVSFIAYNTAAETLIAPTAVDAESREAIARRIDGIAAQGDTCISCAIEAGLEVLRAHDGRVNRILLLSDGQATAGVRDVDGFQRLAERARDDGCSISSIGVDAEYNERIMTTVASASNGRHYFVAEPGGLGAIFDRELESLQVIVATGAELTVELAPGVELLEVYDRTYERRGHAVVASMGMFTRVETKTLLLKVRLPETEEGKIPVADVRLGYRDLTSDDAGVEVAAPLVASASADPARSSELDPAVGARVERAQTTAALWEANRLFQVGEGKQATRAVADRRAALEAERSSLLARAAPSKRAAIEADVDRQLAVLGGATRGFDAPAAPRAKGAPKPAPPARAGKVQIRQNAYDAFDLAY